MSREISTENAPAAIGPYVQGVDLGSMIITSGQIPVDPKTGDVADDISAQARQSLENVQAIVEAAASVAGKRESYRRSCRSASGRYRENHRVCERSK